MTSKRKNWTSEEDSIVIEEVKLHPTQLYKGFTIAADRLNRTLNSVASRWYGKLRKGAPVFGVFSDATYSFNNKNSIGNPIKKKHNIFSKIKKLLGL